MIVNATDRPKPLLQSRQFFVLLLAAALSATLLIAYLLWTARQDAVETAKVTALNYARTLEVRLNATFRRADSVLRTLARGTPVEALAPDGERQYAQRLNAELDSMLHEFDELIALRIIDEHGNQRYVASSSAAQSANYADRSFFAAYRDDRQAGLLFTEALMGRVSLKPTVVMTRPVRDAEGRFRGAVLAPLDLSYFQEHFRRIDIGRSGAVFLRRSDDGALLLRWPQIDAEVNKPMPASHPILVDVRAGKAEAVNEYIAFTDGVRRISGTVVVKGYPYFLSVALSRDDALAGWRRLALVVGLSWAVLLALSFALLRRLWRAESERHSLEGQLRDSQRIESIGTLAGGIAHDFNNILAAILGNVALARGDLADDHPAQLSLAQIHKAGARARDLVQQILAFGRRQPHALVNQPLQPLIDEALTLLRSTLPASVALETTLADTPLHANADATQIQQVLMNLCTNAWHALEGRPGRIQVGLERLDSAGRKTHAERALPPGELAHLWVRDSGVGMDAATQARVFEPFFTTKPSGQGTGLGLSVVHGIVAAHHGAIRVESAPGQGSTMHLYLPTVAPAPPVAEQPADTSAVLGSGQHVFYVDDDEVMLPMVERLLEQSGYRVSAFRDGRDALAAVRADPQAVDLVVTDFNMPGYSGMEVARALALVRPDLPVLISSGYISDELQRDAAAAGVRGLLQKEHTFEELARLVWRTLAG